MTTRHNTCTNPGVKVNTTGWSGGAAPTRVTGLTGYNRTTGARYTGGSFLQTPAGAAAPGDVVTVSFDVLTEVFDDPSIDLYMFATRSAGGDVQIGAIDHPTLTNNVVSRFAITRTCPALTTGVYALADSINMVISPTVATAVLIEVAASAGTYFDGDTTPGGSWDGTNGLSASTLSSGITQAIGTAVETDTARPLGRTKTRALGPATETDTAQPISRRKTRSVGTAVETDTAMPLGGAQLPVGQGPRETTRAPVGRDVAVTPVGRDIQRSPVGRSLP